MIFLLYHSPTETGGLILEALRNLNLPFQEIYLFKGDPLPSINEVSGLVVMGGPMNVYEEEKYSFLAQETDLIRGIISMNKPVLGICLGSQLIAKALGAKVFKNPVKEVGWHPIEWNGSQITVLHWHGDTFDLPLGSTLLASSIHCKNQAFKLSDHTLGLQFHLEATPEMIKNWCVDDAQYILSASENAEKIVSQTNTFYPALKIIANEFFSTYLRKAYA
ncbi:MAG: type 1 glutamine amidotransferase [Elusimicrobiota bacterium]